MFKTWVGIGIILIIAFFFYLLFRLILSQLLPAKKGKNRVLGIVYGFFLLHICIWIYLIDKGIEISKNLGIYFIFTICLLGFYVLISLFDLLFIEYYLSKKKRIYIPPLVHKVIFITMFSLVILFLLRFILNFNPFALVTVSAVITAVLGFALQDTFGSFFAGLTLGKLLRIGDWVSIGENEGRIIATDWMRVKLRNWKGDCLVIPNSMISKQIFVNYSMPKKEHACYLNIGTSYNDPPNKVKRILLDIALNTKGVLKSPPPWVRLMGYGDFSINYMLVVWIEDYSIHREIENEIYTKIWYQFKRNNITIPFPIRTLYMATKSKEEIEKEEKERIEYLKNLLKRVDFLTPLSEEDILSLIDKLKRRVYGKGELVIKKGEKGESLFIVESGEVEVSVVHRGEKKILAYLKEGEFFGEMSLLTGEGRTADVTTVEDTVFLELCKEDFASILSKEPKLVEKMSKILAERETKMKEELKEEEKEKMEEEVKKVSHKFLSRIKKFFTIS